MLYCLCADVIHRAVTVWGKWSAVFWAMKVGGRMNKSTESLWKLMKFGFSCPSNKPVLFDFQNSYHDTLAVVLIRLWLRGVWQVSEWVWHTWVGVVVEWAWCAAWCCTSWWVCNDVIGISSPDSTAEDALFWHTLLSEQTLISMCVRLCFYSYGSLLAIIWKLNLVCFLLCVVGVVVWVKLLHPSLLQACIGVSADAEI